MRARSLSLLVVVLATTSFTWLTQGAEPKTIDVEWQNACGGSNIRVTHVGHQIVLVDASVEHFHEGWQWICLYKDGVIVAATYRHYDVTRRVDNPDEAIIWWASATKLIRTYVFPQGKTGWDLGRAESRTTSM